MKPTRLEIGSVIHGTMREEDLIPAFIAVLENLELSREEVDLIDDVKRHMKQSDYESGDASYYLNDVLFNLLNDHVPPDCYFGSTEGDGSDYGCWPTGDEKIDMREQIIYSLNSYVNERCV